MRGTHTYIIDFKPALITAEETRFPKPVIKYLHAPTRCPITLVLVFQISLKIYNLFIIIIVQVPVITLRIKFHLSHFKICTWIQFTSLLSTCFVQNCYVSIVTYL